MAMNYEERLAYSTGLYNDGLERVKNDPQPEGQKFPIGTFVMVSHRGPARVEYVYSHAFPPSAGFGTWNVKDYSLLIRYKDGTWSSCAWYDESKLTEITDKELLEALKAELAI